MARWDHTLTNPGAETGDTTGWTNEAGGLSVRTSSPAPYAGSYYFFGGANSYTKASQEVDLISDGVAADDIDKGILTFVLGAMCASYKGKDQCQLGIRFKDSGKTEISTTTNTLWAARCPQNWYPRIVYGEIPPNTRYIDVLIIANRTDGINNDAYFDDIYCYTTSNHRRIEKVHIEFCDLSSSNPADGWTEYWNTGDFSTSIGSGVLKVDVSAYTPCAAVCDDVGNVLNGEMSAIFYATDDRSYGEGLCCRVSGTAGGENGYHLYANCSSDQLVLARYINGSKVTLASVTPSCMTLNDDTNHYMRFRFYKDKFYGKIWRVRDNEPSSWDLEYTDGTPYLISGGAGVTNIAYDVWFSYFTYDSIGLLFPIVYQRNHKQHYLMR